ncbi:unconventional prefoldin RPB5 interactor-like isoform X2 [Acanthaster planci]|nr:unconventional prefoldin RPB5 interactor-like isoform X2 [Acanthaster planci]
MDPAHVSRLKEEQEHSLEETLVRIKKWKKFIDDYTALQDRLRTLPDKVTHNIMVPFGPVAFIPGHIVHTNEIMVLLGDNWFAERSAKQACEIIDRRKDHLKSMLSDLAKQRHLLESRLGFTSELKDMSENKGDLVDIREEYDPEKEAKWREERKKKRRDAAALSRQRKSQGESDPSSREASLEALPIQRDDAQSELQSQTSSGGSSLGQVTEGGEGAAGSKHRDPEMTEEEIWASGVRGFMTEEELWARLDELEQQEEELDELALMSDGEEDQTNDSTDEQHPRVNQGRHVRWCDEGNSDNEENESDSQGKPPTITFKHTQEPDADDKVSSESAAPPNPTEVSTAVMSPADIYKQYTSLAAPSPDGGTPVIVTTPQHNQPLKSILKTSVKPTSVRAVESEEGTETKETKTPVILPAPLSAFSGQVTERPRASASQDAAATIPPDAKDPKAAPPKRVSHFKAARQQRR